MLPIAAGLLLCPHGEPSLRLTDDRRGLVCGAGHRFDLARQGYVNLLPAAAPAGVDTAQMVSARARFLEADHHAPLTDALVDAAGDLMAARTTSVGDGDVGPVVVDLGAGTGHHLAAVLDALGGADPVGIAIDLSKHAARRAARAHARMAAIVADVWSGLPIRDATVDLVLNVFAPRSAAEIGRILQPGGRLVVVTPAPAHLAPLVELLGLLAVDPAKADHLDERLANVVEPVTRREVAWTRALTRDEAAELVAMGPSSWHTDVEVVARHLGGLAEPIEVTFAVMVSTYKR